MLEKNKVFGEEIAKKRRLTTDGTDGHGRKKGRDGGTGAWCKMGVSGKMLGEMQYYSGVRPDVYYQTGLN